MGQGDARHRDARWSPARAATRRRCRSCARTSPRSSPRSRRARRSGPEDLAGEGELDLLIATDCISEGQNLQDCDWLINYDIHWNPVRIIQRFGRIDRIGSPNERIQLVNFWPNMELEEYINLEQRVSGRMVLLDISATGEENLIEQQSGNQMNDLEYRRKQLLKLQDAVIDLEDLSTGVSIADLTLTDFRIDLAQYLKAHPGVLESLPLGTCAVTTTTEAEIAAGHHLLPARRRRGGRRAPPRQAIRSRRTTSSMSATTARCCCPTRRPSRSSTASSASASAATCPMPAPAPASTRPPSRARTCAHAQRLLAAAVASVVGKSEERAVASLFTPGGTHALKGEFAGHQRLRGGGLPRRPAGGRRVNGDDAARRPRPARRRARGSARAEELLLENGAPTAADKRHINDGIEELQWVAALKPTTIGVAEYRDDDARVSGDRGSARHAAGGSQGRRGSSSWSIGRCRIRCCCSTEQGERVEPVARPQALVAGRGGQDGAGGRGGGGGMGRRARR